MKGKLGLVVGFGLGYVLGSRAGRARYEQIKRTADKVWHSDPVQKASGVVGAYVSEQVAVAQGFVADKSRSLLHAATAPRKSEDLSVQSTATEDR